MKNKLNSKLLIVTVLGAISMNGCVSKSIEIKDTNNVSTSKSTQVKVSKWKNLNKSKNDDCIDCYANIAKKPLNTLASADNSKSIYSSDVYPLKSKPLKKYKNTYQEDNPYKIDEGYNEASQYMVDASYVEDNTEYQTSYSSKNHFSNKSSIQVGAFRKYAGAKVYAKRYSLLTTKYNVEIKKNVKDNQPLYRVQIEGFSNESEAKQFMERYGLAGAFLVRR